MLTPYDEYPVHQTPYPVSYIPNTDYAWDEGFFVGVLNPDEQLYMAAGFRVNQNTDMIGGYAMINVAGRQYTTRFSRCWRPDFSMSIGPFRYEILEPLRKLRVVLEKNAGDLAFDLLWEGTCPPVLEKHHLAEHRGRRTTDQSRYTQPGKVSGHLQFKDRSYKVTPDSWTGARDHSWGLYSERPPLMPASEWLPPRHAANSKRAFRIWSCFRTDPISGFFEMNEDSQGRQRDLNDVFGVPFSGSFYEGWDKPPIELVSASHNLEYYPGTRLLKGGVIRLRDSSDREWVQEITVASPPWMIHTLGYTPGSWKDGGTFHTYHGSETFYTESDEFDFSVQPASYVPYKVTGDRAKDTFNFNFDKPMIQGPEHVTRVVTITPDGKRYTGAAHVENVITGPYPRYGFV